MVNGREDERTFLLRADADTVTKLFTTAIQELAGNFEPVKVYPTGAVHFTAVIAPVHDKRLWWLNVVSPDIVAKAAKHTCPTGPANQQVTVCA